MAKRRKPQRKHPHGGRGRRHPAPPDGSNVPDRRALEGAMREMLENLGGAPATGPAAAAQQLLNKAFDARSPQRRTELAREALAVWPDCADAYVLLAENAPHRKEALELYEQGVAAGERVLGAPMFENEAGRFWGILETRPYMRARLGLAHALWTAGRREEAVGHVQDMLRLNPNDNQGVRYTLAGFLSKLDRDDDLAQLLQQYPEDDLAAWSYTKALLAFRRHGDTAEARRLLQHAIKTNKHVPAYLVGRKHPSHEERGSYTPGEDSEALEYVGGFLGAWKATPGAVAWLRANDTTVPQHKTEAPHARGPLTFIKKWLKEHLPQEDDTWEVEVQQVPNWIEQDGVPVRPWLILVVNEDTGYVLAHDLREEQPTAAVLWDVLVQVMQNPTAGEPHRPAALRARTHQGWDALRPHFAEIGIDLTEEDALEVVDAVLASMNEDVFGQQPPGLLDVPGVGPDQVGRFFEAAADFYRQAPWKRVGYESALKIECGKFDSGPWYGVLMGQSGLTMGLTLYEDLDLLRKLWEGHLSDEANARMTVATTVTFNEAPDLPVADLDAAQQYGWPVARPDAYPHIFHKERGLSMRPPLAWELQLMEACLRAVPGFVARHTQEDPSREEVTVPTANGALTLGLSWMVADA